VSEAKDITDLSLEEWAEVEWVEVELNAFINKRAGQAKDRESAEELWAKSVREYRKKRNQQNAQAWFEYHDHMIRNHEDTLGSLIFYHQKERAKYGRMLGLPEIGQGGEDA
jgi:hypothetical protein